MVIETLTIIENWYKESTGDRDKPLLLSKLAVIEFCGWLEEWMDLLVSDLDSSCLKDPDWTKDNVIKGNNGFHYEKHLRPMICKVIGEYMVREFEIEFEQKHPGDLQQIIMDLGSLWSLRCNLAHSDIAAHRRAQVNVNAPSWTKNQFRVVSKRLEAFKACLLESLQ